MSRSYHSRIIDSFCENLELFIDQLEFRPTEIRRNVRLGRTGEIDLVLVGGNRRALVEVKSHQGLVGKFERKQLPIYKNFDPNADIFLLFGNPGQSVNPNDFSLVRYA